MNENNNLELTMASDDLTLLQAYPGYIQKLIERLRIVREESKIYNASIVEEKGAELRDLTKELDIKTEICSALQQEWIQIQADEKDIQEKLNARKQSE